jgi:TolA-binding protein
MKFFEDINRLAVVLILFMNGCSFTREPLRYREVFFRPVTVLPQRSHPTLSSGEYEQLKNKLESATMAAMMMRDSLASLRRFTDSVLASKGSRTDTIHGWESNEFLTTTQQTDMEDSPAEFQSENKELSRHLKEIRTQVFASTINTTSADFSTASTSSSKKKYTQGITFFKQRRYVEARMTFSSLLTQGIEDDVADNCEYWIGECRFACGEYADAIHQFQKVLAFESSNKKMDAYFMLGKTYEHTGDMEKARTVYKELIKKYPANGHAQIAKYRLDVLKNTFRSEHAG